jgi:hypothetical protein
VDIAIDDLEVRHSPKIDQCRPSRISVVAPNPEERDTVVNFGVLPQTTGLATAPRPQAPQ